MEKGQCACVCVCVCVGGGGGGYCHRHNFCFYKCDSYPSYLNHCKFLYLLVI